MSAHVDSEEVLEPREDQGEASLMAFFGELSHSQARLEFFASADHAKSRQVTSVIPG